MSNFCIDQQAVFQAANTLSAQGLEPAEITVAMLRNALGGGSLSALLPLLREWLTDNASGEVQA